MKTYTFSTVDEVINFISNGGKLYLDRKIICTNSILNSLLETPLLEGTISDSKDRWYHDISNYPNGVLCSVWYHGDSKPHIDIITKFNPKAKHPYMNDTSLEDSYGWDFAIPLSKETILNLIYKPNTN